MALESAIRGRHESTGRSIPQGDRIQALRHSYPSTESLKKVWLFYPLCELLRLQNGLHLLPLCEPLPEVVGTSWGDGGLRYLFLVSLNTWLVSKFRKILDLFQQLTPKGNKKIPWHMAWDSFPWWSFELLDIDQGLSPSWAWPVPGAPALGDRRRYFLRVLPHHPSWDYRMNSLAKWVIWVQDGDDRCRVWTQANVNVW